MDSYTGKLTVLMPAHDEGAGIYGNLGETLKVLEGNCRDYEVIVIDDGSSDNTFEEASRFADENPCVRLVKNQTNLGKGHGLQ